MEIELPVVAPWLDASADEAADLLFDADEPSWAEDLPLGLCDPPPGLREVIVGGPVEQNLPLVRELETWGECVSMASTPRLGAQVLPGTEDARVGDERVGLPRLRPRLGPANGVA